MFKIWLRVTCNEKIRAVNRYIFFLLINRTFWNELIAIKSLFFFLRLNLINKQVITSDIVYFRNCCLIVFFLTQWCPSTVNRKNFPWGNSNHLNQPTVLNYVDGPTVTGNPNGNLFTDWSSYFPREVVECGLAII